jgi:large subunit ribosomal protein L32e
MGLSTEKIKRIKVGLRKPRFSRPYHWTRSKLDAAWRKPKGIDNKLRHAFKGYPATVNVGYRSPRNVRGRHPSGLIPVHVSTASELDKIDGATHCVVISAKLGAQKFAALETLAVEKGVVVLNGKQSSKSIVDEDEKKNA